MDHNNERLSEPIDQLNNRSSSILVVMMDFFKELFNSSFKKKSKWFSMYYLFDWILSFIGVIVIELVFGAYFGGIEPPQRYAVYKDMTDSTISFPNLESIVPDYMLISLNTLIPIILILIFQIKYKSIHDIHHGILTWFETFALTICVTDVMKVGAGRLRPDFLSRCIPSPLDGKCTNDNLSLVRDGKLSFPSGHSSLSFACMMFCVLYMMSKFKIYSSQQVISPTNNTTTTTKMATSSTTTTTNTVNTISSYGGNASLWKLLVCLSPLALAAFIAISRTLDYHHNFSDILGGCVLGLFIAPCCYFLNYPSLFALNCDVPLNRYYLNVMVDSYALSEEEHVRTLETTTNHTQDENILVLHNVPNQTITGGSANRSNGAMTKRSLSVQDQVV
ncbi:hypothetical protein C9374_008141 [Naegleria lovaniensis]|uniref:Phosphatidic acid phosphatase type 2/haloperoxidase domain-containing protein n=1 Tax=Naegleria lovaniensis TaxID=51637 RepID=A0AA88GFH8_NAELO|nr:uncharacterized protein C9374_008141 [Naegleria lovaniensis]KAG2378502.1 hypothetical protein C9374_008141 [Naegleria lovaniensis]